MMDKPYDYRNCQSLFDYAQAVHKRSTGICQLCGCGAAHPPDFDMWRQLTVEHLIGAVQGGHPKELRVAVGVRFKELSPEEREQIVHLIDEANTVTACSFCNSSTSRDLHTKSMQEILQAEGSTGEVIGVVLSELAAVLEQKRAKVQWKLVSVREMFDRVIVPEWKREERIDAS